MVGRLADGFGAVVETGLAEETCGALSVTIGREDIVGEEEWSSALGTPGTGLVEGLVVVADLTGGLGGSGWLVSTCGLGSSTRRLLTNTLSPSVRDTSSVAAERIDSLGTVPESVTTP